jgi:hypothetical protein
MYTLILYVFISSSILFSCLKNFFLKNIYLFNYYEVCIYNDQLLQYFLHQSYHAHVSSLEMFMHVIFIYNSTEFANYTCIGFVRHDI